MDKNDKKSDKAKRNNNKKQRRKKTMLMYLAYKTTIEISPCIWPKPCLTS